MTRSDKIFLLLLMVLCLLAQVAHGQVPTGNIPAGVYTLNADQFVRDSDMIAVGAVTIKGTGRLYIQNVSNRPSLTIKGITFSGVQLIPDLSNTPAMNPNIVIDNNVFQDGAHIRWHNGLANGRITNNAWIDKASLDGYSIIGLSYNGLTIANNELGQIHSGIHVDARTASNNLLVEQNVVSGYSGIAVELQGTATNVIVQDNYILDPFVRASAADVGGYSMILDKSTTIRFQRNTSISSTNQLPRYVDECGGDDVLHIDNYFVGGWDAWPMNDGVGGATVTVRDNRVSGTGKPATVTITHPDPSRKVVQGNNGPGVLLTWDVNRQKPGRNRRLGSTPPPSTAPTTNLSDYRALEAKLNLTAADRDRLRTRLDGISVEAGKP